MPRFREILTYLSRPFIASSIPERLAMPAVEAEGYVRGKMEREASLAASEDFTLGVFDLLGVDEAHFASRAWRPGVLLAMEDVSLAFSLVEQQRLTGEIVSRENLERLTEALLAYFRRSGRPRTKAALQSQIACWLAESSSPDAETVSPVRRRIGVRLPLLYELRQIDDEVAARFIGMHGRPATLECIGLILDEELDDSRYNHCTPLNCRTFANTGGDGEHFSLLVVDDAITENSPVVVTAPSSGGESYVLAASLFEFLRLGCRKGYFSLGSLPYDFGKTLREYLGPEGELPVADYLSNDYQIQVRDYLCQRLNLNPWPNRAQFDELQTLYAGQLRYPPI